MVYQQWLQLRFHFLALSSPVETLLCKLKQRGYNLGLITNGPSNAQWEKVRLLKLECYFDIILVSGDLPWEKPAPNIFLQACSFLKVDPKSCLMVGDKLETDILGGSILGATVWINDQDDIVADYYNVKCKPDFTLREVTELAFILQIQISASLSPDYYDDSSSNSNSSDGS